MRRWMLSVLVMVHSMGFSGEPLFGAEALVECEVPGIFAQGTVWRCLTSGHAGCEGAQWKDGTLYYAAHHDGYAFRWSPQSGLRIWRRDSPEATSFRPDGAGGFYVVEQTTRQLARWNASGERVEVLADRFEGKRLNRPNDCVVKSDGTVWFTDPDFLFSKRPEDRKELSGQFVFCWDPRSGGLRRSGEGFNKPNGIVFSPDEKFLFIGDSGSSELFRMSVKSDGSLEARERVAFFVEKGLDGLGFDPMGRLWVCTARGITILAGDGQVLGCLKIPGQPTSLAFGAGGELCVTTRDACFITSTQFRP